jgi:DNA polymerase-3 subunit delta
MNAPPPVTLVRTGGDDPSVLAAAVRRVIDDLVGSEDRGLALEDLGAEATVAQVVDACQTPPFLSSRRIIVARDVGRWSAADVEPIVGYLNDPLSTTALVLVGGSGQTPVKLVNAVKACGTIIDAAVPAGRGRTSWLVEQLRAGPVVFDAAAAERLGSHLGEDVGRLPGLLEALGAAYGPGARIGVEELEPFLGEAGGVAPWDLTDAIDRGDTAGALGTLHRLLGGGDRHPLGVLATLHRHYAAMLRLDSAGAASDADAAALTGMAPFPAGKALRGARRLGFAGVARAMTLLADADLDLRGVRDWPDALVMEVLVARLSRLGGQGRGRAAGPPARRTGGRR